LSNGRHFHLTAPGAPAADAAAHVREMTDQPLDPLEGQF
jgi:hypothetical protein